MEEKTKNVISNVIIVVLIIIWFVFIRKILEYLSVYSIIHYLISVIIIEIPYIVLILYVARKDKNIFPLGYNIIVATLISFGSKIATDFIQTLLGRFVRVVDLILPIIILIFGIHISRKKEIDYSKYQNNYGTLKVISFLIPIVGLIVYAVNIVQNPEIAKECGKFALIGFGIGIVLSIVSAVIIFA